ncbi:hypothetical protein BXY85_3958 [Roseivirga pacifica]|uniref:Uncharacterized protein n=1 Tax=Roseivirga pacifica TaxID=1267423 RepID=A0A1I0Q1D8_9BACT|nr:hypothetical protein BXY85_3958 [Roseivirga pacifica]SEW20697.1 hypothetical protein SAMN05216290_1917 [Roseivirga pacifica]
MYLNRFNTFIKLKMLEQSCDTDNARNNGQQTKNYENQTCIIRPLPFFYFLNEFSWYTTNNGIGRHISIYNSPSGNY